MNWETLQIEIEKGIALVRIDRPKALNALNEPTLRELESAFDALTKDEGVQVIILSGSGEKAFVAGADIVAMQPMSAHQARAFAALGHRVMQSIEACPKPVIAAVNGFALGGGCELALCCDIRLAGENARFGQPEVNLGVIPGFGGTQRLARLIGKGRASEMLMSGDMIDAVEAHRIGLVNRIYAAEELLPAARKLAEKIATKGLIAVSLVKAALRDGLETDQTRACAHEADLFALCFATADQEEGMQAFLEKRPANFEGK